MVKQSDLARTKVPNRLACKKSLMRVVSIETNYSEHTNCASRCQSGHEELPHELESDVQAHSPPQLRRSTRVAARTPPRTPWSEIRKQQTKVQSAARAKRCGWVTHRDMIKRSREDEKRIYKEQDAMRDLKEEMKRFEGLPDLLESAGLMNLQHMKTCKRAVNYCVKMGFESMKGLCEADCKNARRFFDALNIPKGSDYAIKVWEKLDLLTPVHLRGMNFLLKLGTALPWVGKTMKDLDDMQSNDDDDSE